MVSKKKKIDIAKILFHRADFTNTNNAINEPTYLICSGTQSCLYQTTSLRNMYIFCDGHQACKYSSFSISGKKFDPTIACRGRASCDQTTLSNAHTVLCLGRSSCTSSTIRNVDAIYGLGYSSLQGTTIYSDGIGEMNVSLGAVDAGNNLLIHCNQVDDICTIKCYAEACQNTNVTCHWKATCNIDCDENNGILCPNVTIYTTPTKAPSFIPSAVPTFLPSTDPTRTPTFNPSVPPTSGPTPPTSHPTTLPTIQPSVDPSASPTTIPTFIPTEEPSLQPTFQPIERMLSLMIVYCC